MGKKTPFDPRILPFADMILPRLCRLAALKLPFLGWQLAFRVAIEAPSPLQRAKKTS